MLKNDSKTYPWNMGDIKIKFNLNYVIKNYNLDWNTEMGGSVKSSGTIHMNSKLVFVRERSNLKYLKLIFIYIQILIFFKDLNHL